jgi:hypothetical protein
VINGASKYTRGRGSVLYVMQPYNTQYISPVMCYFSPNLITMNKTTTLFINIINFYLLNPIYARFSNHFLYENVPTVMKMLPFIVVFYLLDINVEGDSLHSSSIVIPIEQQQNQVIMNLLDTYMFYNITITKLLIAKTPIHLIVVYMFIKICAKKGQNRLKLTFWSQKSRYML